MPPRYSYVYGKVKVSPYASGRWEIQLLGQGKGGHSICMNLSHAQGITVVYKGHTRLPGWQQRTFFRLLLLELTHCGNH